MATITHPCANPACASPGIEACKECLLVAYCGMACQTSHWPAHKAYCCSPLAKPGWKPGWEKRWRRHGIKPAFCQPEYSHRVGREKHLWGNVPAIDVVKLADNEGVDFEGPINVLFAASGDIRNLVKSVIDLPDEYTGTMNAVLNDWDMDVVAHNLVMLLLLFGDTSELSSSQVAENVVHVWYSALLPWSCVAALAKASVLVREVCDKISSKPADALLGKSWAFTHGSNTHMLRAVLSRDQWLQLAESFSLPRPLTADEAQQIRRETVIGPARTDYLHRRLYLLDAKHRVSAQRFKDDGILLPFGHSRHGFDTPNPTLYRDAAAKGWPMQDSSDPVDSYGAAEVRDFPFPLVANDFYGKLHALVKSRLGRFRDRLKSMTMTVKVHCADVTSLPARLESGSLTRIDVSNITDGCYVGTQRTLELLMGCLQPPGTNPHAALIAMYMNAVQEMTNMNLRWIFAPGYMSAAKTMLRYMEGRGVVFPPPEPDMIFDADMQCFIHNGLLTRDFTGAWNDYVAENAWDKLCDSMGLSMDRNSIVPAWPYTLKLKLGQPGAQTEFGLAWSSNLGTWERFVEWRRVR